MRAALSAPRNSITPWWLLDSRLVLFKFLRYLLFVIEKFEILCLVTWVRVTFICFVFGFCFCFFERVLCGYAIFGVMLWLPIVALMRFFFVGLNLGSFNGLLTSRYCALRIWGDGQVMACLSRELSAWGLWPNRREWVHLRQRVGPRWRGGSILRLRLVAYCERDGDIWQRLCSRPGMLVAASPRMRLSGLHETGASWVIWR